jgi:3-methyladenine DNA glycosylase AlkD
MTIDQTQIAAQVGAILDPYDPETPAVTADALRDLWLGFEAKSIAGIKVEDQEVIGVPVPDLKTIGKEFAKAARVRGNDFVPLVRLLWDVYGREGRVVALIPLGVMELQDPETIMALLMEMCLTSETWEDVDRLAMDALEPIVRKNPGEWLSSMDAWLADGNKWVRRAGVTVVARLPMKHPEYTERCLEMAARLLYDGDTDVKKATSFAIRISARGDVDQVVAFLARHVPPEDPAATWVLCDAIRSMTKTFLPTFVPLLPRYEAWAADPSLAGQDRRSVESAIKVLKVAAEG